MDVFHGLQEWGDSVAVHKTYTPERAVTLSELVLHFTVSFKVHSCGLNREPGVISILRYVKLENFFKSSIDFGVTFSENVLQK